MIIALIYNLVFAYPVYFIVVKIDAKLQYWIKDLNNSNLRLEINFRVMNSSQS